MPKVVRNPSMALGVNVTARLSRPRLLGLAIFSTALAFCFFFRLVRTLGSVGATAQAHLRVPIGVAMAPGSSASA